MLVLVSRSEQKYEHSRPLCQGDSETQHSDWDHCLRTGVTEHEVKREDGHDGDQPGDEEEEGDGEAGGVMVISDEDDCACLLTC